jgi:C1A family cysteine protease
VKPFLMALLFLCFATLTAYSALTPELEPETFEEKENWVTEHLEAGGSIEEVTGLDLPANWHVGADFIEVDATAMNLPERFDWRERSFSKGHLQPVRNQGKCGSCWAFSVVAVFEALLYLLEQAFNVDLAEQTLVSSCSNSGSCRGGYFSAFNYLVNPGVPDEAADPYKAQNTSCKAPFSKVNKLFKWSYIRGPGNSSPTVAQMKAALLQYGPLSVDVNASFSGYSSGIYNRCNQSRTNHMVNIEGYDDADGGYWIMRNSWGENWGENGYMRIRYTDSKGNKCNGIGRIVAVGMLHDQTGKRKTLEHLW